MYPVTCLTVVTRLASPLAVRELVEGIRRVTSFTGVVLCFNFVSIIIDYNIND